MKQLHVVQPFGDAEHKFQMTLEGIRELQDITGSGPMEIVRRLVGGTWREADVRHTIRLGLFGAGMKPAEVISLMTRYFDTFPLADHVPLAASVLEARIFGVEAPDAPAVEETAQAVA